MSRSASRRSTPPTPLTCSTSSAARRCSPLRGEPAVDRAALVDVLLALSRLAESEPDVVSVDLNPLVVEQGTPVAVDALVETT